MKYLLVIGDGMADNPVFDLGGKTPLQFANIPALDALAAMGIVGSVNTVPGGVARRQRYGDFVNLRLRSACLLYGTRAPRGGSQRHNAHPATLRTAAIWSPSTTPASLLKRKR